MTQARRGQEKERSADLVRIVALIHLLQQLTGVAPDPSLDLLQQQQEQQEEEEEQKVEEQQREQHKEHEEQEQDEEEEEKEKGTQTSSRGFMRETRVN